jgi:CheY-like chemotaxis protein
MSGCILLVEDDDTIRESLAAILGEEGYSVVEAENGKVALDWLLQNPAPHMILLDLYMPVMNGMDFRAEQVQNPALRAIPVVVISAEDPGKTTAWGFDRLVRKPIDLDELLTCVGELCSSSPAD